MGNEKVRLLVEVSEDTINECKVLFGQGYANNAEYAISQGIIVTEDDCISRSDLKKEIGKMPNANPSYSHKCDVICREDVIELIDNAQAIDLWKMRQEATENALKKAEVLYARPKGEWKEWTDERWGGTTIYCPYCKEEALEKYSD